MQWLMKKFTEKLDNFPTQVQTRAWLSAARLRKLNSKRKFTSVILERIFDVSAKCSLVKCSLMMCFRFLMHSMARRVWWSVHLSSQMSAIQVTLLHLSNWG